MFRSWFAKHEKENVKNYVDIHTRVQLFGSKFIKKKKNEMTMY